MHATRNFRSSAGNGTTERTHLHNHIEHGACGLDVVDPDDVGVLVAQLQLQQHQLAHGSALAVHSGSWHFFHGHLCARLLASDELQQYAAGDGRRRATAEEGLRLGLEPVFVQQQPRRHALEC